jgi:hypothetical protein
MIGLFVILHKPGQTIVTMLSSPLVTILEFAGKSLELSFLVIGYLACRRLGFFDY